MLTPALEFPHSIRYSSLGDDSIATSYNLSESYKYKSLKVRLYRGLGIYEDRAPNRGLHKIRPALSNTKWGAVQEQCPYIEWASFVTVEGIPGPNSENSSSMSTAVGLISPFHEKGNILEQCGAGKQQNDKWLIQVCKAVACLHENGLQHGNIHPRNILIKDDGSSVLTDSCIYSLTMQHLAPSLSSDYYHEISTPKTVACKRPSTIRDANFPAVEVTKRDDIFALAVTILMVYIGKEPWNDKHQAIRRILDEGRPGHQNFEKPNDMNMGLWRLLQVIFRDDPRESMPTIEGIIQELGRE